MSISFLSELVKGVLNVIEYFSIKRRKKEKSPKESSNLERKLQGIGLVDFHKRRLASLDWDVWFEDMKKARQVDLLGNNLRTLVARNVFCNVAKEAVKLGCTFRILVLDNNSQIARLRVIEECEDREKCIKMETIPCGNVRDCPHKNIEKGHDFIHQTACINATLGKLKSLKQTLNDDENERLKIKLVDKVNIRCYIVRVDDKMFAAPYLGKVPGSDLPTMELSGRDTHLFQIFIEEFEGIWRVSKEWDWSKWGELR